MGYREQQLELKGNISTFLPVIQATSEQLSWFGETPPHPSPPPSQQRQPGAGGWRLAGGVLRRQVGRRWAHPARFGPRRTIMAFCLPAILAWLLIGLAPK